MQAIDRIRDQLKEKGLKVTPQRIIVFEAVQLLGHHPTREPFLSRTGAAPILLSSRSLTAFRSVSRVEMM